MVTTIPKWLMNRYSALWQKFGKETFTFQKAMKFLDEDIKTLNVVFSELKKAGWIEVRPNKEDARKRDYKLKPPEDVIGAISR